MNDTLVLFYTICKMCWIQIYCILRYVKNRCTGEVSRVAHFFNLLNSFDYNPPSLLFARIRHNTMLFAKLLRLV